jgi:hypothetical protein
MTHPEVEEWLRTAAGVAMDPDKSYGNQCVDLADAYGEALFGVPWNVCVGGVNGARELLDAAPDKYWIRVDNDPNDPNLLPPRGALCVTSGDNTNPYGHVYGVLEARANGVTAIQQDGFAAPRKFVNGGWYSDKPAHVAELPWYGPGIGTLKGWLIPRENMIVDTGAAARLGLSLMPASTGTTTLLDYQRTTMHDSQVGYRKGPGAGAELIRWFDPDTIYDFKGFVRREAVNGNDIWFVGRYSDGFAWSGGFTDKSTTGLPDLTDALFPAPAAAPTGTNKRVTGKDGVNRRKQPDKNAELINTFGPDLELTLGGYVIATDPYGQGNRIWFVGGISGGYMHSSGFTDQSVAGLPQLPEPADLSPVAPKPVYDFVPDFDWVEKAPANITNLELDRGPKKDTGTVIHQMGTPGTDTIGSTVNEFQRENAFKSSHLTISGKTAKQMVALKDRAYHAGTYGNDLVGIETDPYQDEDTIATTRRALADLKQMGYSSALIRHKDVKGNNTSCGTLIDLSRYEVTDVLPVPEKPVEQPPVAGPEVPGEVLPLPVVDDVNDFINWLGEKLIREYREDRTNG